MDAEKREKHLAWFMARYRRMWLGLFVLAMGWTPFATLGFIGALSWLSSSTALFTWLATIALALTLFVAGRWEAGYSNGRIPREDDDHTY